MVYEHVAAQKTQMVYEHAAVWEVHQMVYEHVVAWKTQMVYKHVVHGRFIHCKIWQSIVIRVHWCTHRNLTGNITSLLCFIFIVRAILRFTDVAIGYVRIPDDIPLKMIRGYELLLIFPLFLPERHFNT